LLSIIIFPFVIEAGLDLDHTLEGEGDEVEVEVPDHVGGAIEEEEEEGGEVQAADAEGTTEKAATVSFTIEGSELINVNLAVNSLRNIVTGERIVKVLRRLQVRLLESPNRGIGGLGYAYGGRGRSGEGDERPRYGRWVYCVLEEKVIDTPGVILQRLIVNCLVHRNNNDTRNL